MKISLKTTQFKMRAAIKTIGSFLKNYFDFKAMPKKYGKL